MADLDTLALQKLLQEAVTSALTNAQAKEDRPRVECLRAMENMQRELERKIDKLVTMVEALTASQSVVQNEVSDHDIAIDEMLKHLDKHDQRIKTIEDYVAEQVEKRKRLENRKDDVFWGGVNAAVKWAVVVVLAAVLAYMAGVHMMKKDYEDRHLPGVEDTR